VIIWLAVVATLWLFRALHKRHRGFVVVRLPDLYALWCGEHGKLRAANLRLVPTTVDMLAVIAALVLVLALTGALHGIGEETGDVLRQHDALHHIARHAVR
jgi:hypothetical protein